MTQPSFVPIGAGDQVRPALRLEPPRHWVADRPAELRFPVRPGGRQLGTPGPDQGYALRLARRFEDRLVLTGGESTEDALVGCALLAARRAAIMGRAPTVFDVETALALWGFVADDPPAGLVAARRLAFSSAAHDYVVQRTIADRVPEAALRLGGADVDGAVAAGRWRDCRGVSAAAGGRRPASGVERLEIVANGLRFSARAAGAPDGRPVILLHGFPQSSLSWQAILPILAGAGYRAVAPDQRGYSPGARPADVSAYRISELVADVLAIAETMQMPSFDLVGHDWGGMVAWVLASRHPGLVRSLAVVSTPHPGALAATLVAGDTDQVARSAYVDVFRRPAEPERLLLGDDGRAEGLRTMFAATGLPDEQAREYVSFMRDSATMSAALNWYRAMDAAEVEGLPPVVIPTLYVWSTGDAALGRRAAESTAEWVAGRYQFTVLEGVSHWVPEEVPDQLGRLLLAHLGSV